MPGQEIIYRSVTPTLDTSQYADGDVLFNWTEVKDVFTSWLRAVRIESITGLEIDDQGVAFDILFGTSSANNLGTLNNAPNISDANAVVIKGYRSVATGDMIDIGGSRLITVAPVGLVIPSIGATSLSLYVAGITRGGTPTYTAAGITLNFGIIRDVA